MTDTYQAVYDATRSRVSGCDSGDAIQSAIRFVFQSADHHMRCVAQEWAISAAEARRPSAIFRPALSLDGDQWCALYGSDLQNGVAGFGATPELAMHDFDNLWLTQKPRNAK